MLQICCFQFRLISWFLSTATMMAYERRKDTSKGEQNYNYVVVNEDVDDCDSDSSDVFLNGPKKGKSLPSQLQLNKKTQVILCIILVLAIFLLIFVVYNFLTFIFAVQNAMQKLEQQLPKICETARMLNKEVSKQLTFCANLTVPLSTPAGNVSIQKH